MGSVQSQVLIAACLLSLGLCGYAWGAVPSAGVRPSGASLEQVKGEIAVMEADLLDSASRHEKAGNQIRKIRKLLALQKKEITLTGEKIHGLGASLGSLSGHKRDLETQIGQQKLRLQKRIKLLQSMAEDNSSDELSPALDALWISSVDLENGRSYYLMKTFRKNLADVKKLKADMAQVSQIEARINREREELEYYVQELREKNGLLVSNEKLQREIMQASGSRRLEQLSKVRSLKESERDLKRVLGAADPSSQIIAADADNSRLAQLKGKLPYPVTGAVVSGYGRAYDSKTSLLTFQKGISIGAFADSDVKAVAAGKVAYSGALKNYGLMVIVEHPGQLYTLYGQLGKTAVTEGDAVDSGRVVGRTASTGTPLYFEIRDRNIAINPLNWLQNVSVTLNK